MFKYEIYTTIPRNFDPKVMGVTLDSIIESSKGYVNHSVPFLEGDTIIKIETSQPLDIEYIKRQLDDNFRAIGEPTTVKELVRKDL